MSPSGDNGWFVSELVPELVCLGVDIIVSGILYTAYKITLENAKEIKDAANIPLDDKIYKKISENGKALKTVNNEGDELIYIPYAVVQGAVKATSKNKSDLLSSRLKAGDEVHTGLVRSLSITEHKKHLSRTGFWYDTTRQIRELMDVVPFKLHNLASPSKSIDVKDVKNAFKLDLELIHDDYEAADNSLSSHVAGWIEGDMSKGIQTTEKMLKDGSFLYGIGELVFNKSEKTLTLQSPTIKPQLDYYLVKDSPNALIKELESSANYLKWILLAFGGVGIAIGLFSSYRYYKHWLSLRQQRESRERIRNIQSERIENDAITPGSSCVVCLARDREVILLNCGHLCVCADCGDELLARSSTCPICRANIHNVASVYIP